LSKTSLDLAYLPGQLVHFDAAEHQFQRAACGHESNTLGVALEQSVEDIGGEHADTRQAADGIGDHLRSSLLDQPAEASISQAPPHRRFGHMRLLCGRGRRGTGGQGEQQGVIDILSAVSR
jgi:hypothetical protein